jgi:hypothetical protein
MTSSKVPTPAADEVPPMTDNPSVLLLHIRPAHTAFG